MTAGRPASPTASGAGRVRPGRRALFSDGGTTAPGPEPAGDRVTAIPEGRRAFFTAPASERVDPPVATAPTVHGAVAVVTCRTCLARTCLTLGDLMPVLVRSLWLPGRWWSRLTRCPACGRTAWCRIERVAGPERN